MRIVIHDYANGERYAYETTLDGDWVRDIEGNRQVGQRIRAAIEVVCDDNERGREALLDSLGLVTRVVKPAA